MSRTSAVRRRWSVRRWRAALDRLLREHPPAARVNRDPVSLPRRARELGLPPREVEALALFSALLAYGRAEAFISLIRSLVEPRGFSLFRCVRDTSGDWPAYRFSRGPDLRALARAICDLSDAANGLHAVFDAAWRRGGDVWMGLAALRSELLARVPPAEQTSGLLYLLPSVDGHSCAKRWMLFLRWMARPDDGVDLGLWPAPPPAALIVPLDRHVAAFARAFGWTRRKTVDRRMAEEVTAFLRRLDAQDPLRYDFALCHLGIAGVCSPFTRRGECPLCRFQPVCARASSRVR